jgi:hypothetical protein
MSAISTGLFWFSGPHGSLNAANGRGLTLQKNPLDV